MFAFFPSSRLFALCRKRLFVVICALFGGFLCDVVTGAPGQLDSTFGGGKGFVVAPLGVPGNAYARSVAIQDDGKLVLGGDCRPSLCIARFDASGALDTSFGSNGKASATVGVGSNDGRSVAIDSVGRILIAGTCSPTNYAYAFCIARFLPDGTLDATFGIAGAAIVYVYGAGDGFLESMLVQSDGKILLSGSCASGDVAGGACVARLTMNGLTDLTFAGTGSVVLNGASAAGMALQSDGKILVSGNALNRQFSVWRLEPDGTPDARFGVAGRATTAFEFTEPDLVGGSYFAYSVSLRPDGRIVLAGSCNVLNSRFNYSERFCIAQYLPDGTLDSSFGEQGKVVGPGSATNSSSGYGLALQRDGKVLVAGSCSGPVGWAFCLARYLKNGAPDIDFGSAGVVIAKLDANLDWAQGIALQTDGNIVLGGLVRW